VVHKYVTETIGDDALRLLTVWGPMLGSEVRADAEAATALLPDPRVDHFWSEGHGVAERFAPLAGLPAGELAWDTFQVFPAGARWREEPPRPAFVMHVDKRLPGEDRLDGGALAERIHALLAAPQAASVAAPTP
jgi:hypothetical protein